MQSIHVLGLLASLLLGCQPAGESKSSSNGDKDEAGGTVDGTVDAGTDATDSTDSDTDTGGNTDTNSNTNTNSNTDTNTGSNTNTNSNTDTNTGVDPQTLNISGVVKFLVSNSGDSVVADAPVDGATVFLQGFPDQSVLTDGVGAFTIALDLNNAAGLTGTTADYEVVAWKIENNRKYGRRAAADDVEANVNFAMPADVKLAYTQRRTFVPQDGGSDIPRDDCEIILKGYEGKAVVTYPASGNPTGEISVDYLPEGLYEFRSTCGAFPACDGEFTVDFDETQVPNWTDVTYDATSCVVAP